MTKKLRHLLLALIFINGYVSLSLELITLRQISSFVGNTAITASIIIGIFLAFMSWGYYFGSIIKLIKTNSRTIIYNSFIIIAVMVILSASFTFVDSFFNALSNMNIKSNLIKTFTYSFLLLSVAPFLFGLNTAIICRYLHRYNRDYTGRIMAIDTIGSVLGSLLTTLILMPLIGVNKTISIVVCVSLIGAFITKQKKRDFILFPLIIFITYIINSDQLLYKRYDMIENNAVSTILIKSSDNDKSKLMIINGNMASKHSKSDDLKFAYVQYIESNFIRTIPQGETKNILILGAGGFTIGDKDERNIYTFIDIDASLLKISEKYLLDKNLSANKTFIVQDASQFLKDTEDFYDLIILDTYSTLEFIPQDLITTEYFERVKSKLNPNGIVVMNIISKANFDNEFTRKIDNTIYSVFKYNIQRQVMPPFNPWNSQENNNIVYTYYNIPNSGEIYTNDKNSLIYDL